MNAAAELGRNTVSEHQFQPGYGDEQAVRRRALSLKSLVEGLDSNARNTTSVVQCYVSLLILRCCFTVVGIKSMYSPM